MATANGKIVDYSHAAYLPIADGDVVLWDSYGYIRHTTNLTAYAELVLDTRSALKLYPRSHMTKLMTADLERIDKLLRTVIGPTRLPRSLNILGTAIKVIAGTPDFDDFQKVILDLDKLGDNNNRQLSINSQLQKQVADLTNTVNKILNVEKLEQIDTGHLYEILLARNRAIINDLDNIILSIALAQLGLLNPIILDNVEIDSILKIESLNNLTVTDLLLVSKFKVFHDNNLFHFLVKYPRPNIICKKKIILPVAHNNKMLSLRENAVAVCGKDIFSLDGCAGSVMKFCRKSTVMTCAQQLVASTIAKCRTTYGQLDPIQEIDDGLIVINDHSAIVTSDNETILLTRGTYLVTFLDKANVNGTLFLNRNTLQIRAAEIPWATQINITGNDDIMSIPYLRHREIENRQLMNNLAIGYKTGLTATSMILIIFVTIVGIILLATVIRKQRGQAAIARVVENLARTPIGRSGDVPHLGGEELTQNA